MEHEPRQRLSGRDPARWRSAPRFSLSLVGSLYEVVQAVILPKLQQECDKDQQEINKEGYQAGQDLPEYDIIGSDLPPGRNRRTSKNKIIRRRL